MSNAYPLVSVITPSLNQSQYLSAVIDNIASQNYPNIEHIVIDGASTDESVDILKESSASGLSWLSEPDEGQVEAINKGLEMAKGSILTYLNADDLLEPGTIASVVELLSHRSADIVYGDLRYSFDLPDLKKTFVSESPDYDKSKLCLYDYVPQPGTFWTKAVMDSIGLFDDRFDYAFDYEYWLRIAARFEMTRHPSVHATFRVWTDSKSGQDQNKERFLKEIERILFEKWQDGTLTKLTHHDLNYLLSYQSAAQFSLHKPFQNVHFLLKALRRSPHASMACATDKLRHKIFAQRSG